MVSEAAKLGVNIFPMISFADFETAIPKAVATVWPGLEVKACLFHLEQSWCRKIQSLGLNMQYGKNDSEVTVLEENIRPVDFTTNGNVRLLCVGIFIQSYKRQASGTILLENYIGTDSTFSPPVWSDVLHHH
jgi:hypothetical protein